MKTIIIAEAGVNHNGSVELAKEMIRTAKWAGADYIKFQTFISENLVSIQAEKAEYQRKNQTSAEAVESQLDMLKKLELRLEDFILLRDYCREQEIGFLSTPFDLETIDFLDGLDMDMWKIPSGEITNLPYLIKIGKTKKPVILSTGMSDLEEIERAIKVLKDQGCKDIILLHCTTAYPTPNKEVNLKSMVTLKETFHTKVGYSDHTEGIQVSIGAIALGAKIIEKHFTLDKNLEGPDHKASLEPEELRLMIQGIRIMEESLGNGEKIPTESEGKNKKAARKSIVAKTKIKQGDFFTEDNITVKRPGDGISPIHWFEVLGKNAVRDFEKDELINL